MPTLMPSDTRTALGPNGEKCDSRSLLLDRFVDPTARENDRKTVFTRALTKKPDGCKASAWNSFLAHGFGLHHDAIVFAQLQSRLLVNMAGGVMENAGLCLDRFGLPCIPGSAVKGCARRAALAALHEWCETGNKPGVTDADKDNVLKAACARFNTPAEMLAAITRVFGWCEQDWKSDRDKEGRMKSDFA